MISNLKKLGNTISKHDQKSIAGGMDPIVPIGGGGGGGTGGGGGHRCVCFINFRVVDVPCDSTCPDGTTPFCP